MGCRIQLETHKLLQYDGHLPRQRGLNSERGGSRERPRLQHQLPGQLHEEGAKIGGQSGDGQPHSQLLTEGK